MQHLLARLAVFFSALVWAGPLAAFPGRSGPPTVASVPPVKTTDRAAVVRLFDTVYRADGAVPSGFSGRVETGDAGTVSPAYQAATLRRINYFRVMAGLPGDIVFDRALSAKDQQAALLMAANDAVNHFPPRSWRFYSADAADAAGHSLLAVGSAGPGAVDDLMRESGGRNKFVGHRRWLLYPPLRTMGSGSVDDPAGAGRFAGGAVYSGKACAVWSAAGFERRLPSVPEPFVAWPPPGYVPEPLVFPRWSISYPAADFSAATVTVLKHGARIPVALETPQANAAGDNTLVWTLPGNTVSRSVDETYVVTVSRVGIARAPHQFAYRVVTCHPPG